MLKKIAFLVSSLGSVVSSSDITLPETVTSPDITIREDIISDDEYEELEKKGLERYAIHDKALWMYFDSLCRAAAVEYNAYSKLQEYSENVLQTLECMLHAEKHTEHEKNEMSCYEDGADACRILIEGYEKVRKHHYERYINAKQNMLDQLTIQEVIREEILKLSPVIAPNTRNYESNRRKLPVIEENIRILNDMISQL
jgi:hypothetical protein